MSIFPIVGAFYQMQNTGSPALAILQIMQTGTELSLIAEPENPHDPNAIMVIVFSKDLPKNREDGFYDQFFQGYGFSYTEILAENCWQLGYLPKEIAKSLQPFTSCFGKYCTGANGGPKVEIR